MNNGSKSPSPKGHGNVTMSLPDDRSIDYIKQYIDASAKSADRVRFVLIVMVTASILAIVAFWNSWPGSWPTARLIVATNAQKFFDPTTKKKFADEHEIPLYDDELKQKVWPLFFDLKYFKRLKSLEERNVYWNDRLQAYERAEHFIDRHRFADLDHLQQHVLYLERARIEKVITITVPFFGIVFDINDLGIYAGITFVIALLLFRFSLLRELRNLRLVFMQTKTPEHLRLCYDMLAMQQVLTTPPELSRGLPSRKVRQFGWWREAFWNTVSKGLYLIPLAVQFAIFRSDLYSYQDVALAFPGTGGLKISGALLAVNALLTGLCFYLGWKVDKTWRNHATWILKSTTPTQADDEVEGNASQEAESERQAEGVTG